MDINQILDRASKLKIAVIGDLIIDHYIYGVVERISPEAPVPVLVKKDTKTTLGGAGNVLMNLLGLGVDAELFCNYIGNPFWEDLNLKIHCNQYPAALKTRVMCGNHQLVRIDDEIDRSQLSFFNYTQFSWHQELTNRWNEFDAIVISDYGKGTISDSVINTLIEFRYINVKKIFVDAKKDFHRFRGVFCLKCNAKEIGDGDRYTFCKENDIMLLIVTEGERGMSWYSKSGCGGVDGHNVHIVDICGAGDSALAAIAIAFSEESPLLTESLEFANIVASEVCKYPGVVPISKEMLINRMPSQQIKFNDY